RRRRRRRRRRQRPKTTASFCPRSAPLRARGGGPRAPEPAGCWGRAGRRLEGRARRKSTGPEGRGGAEMEVVETALVSSSGNGRYPP
ncbi:unnamed protein product, partial [Prorocentrum cordatum]